MPEDLVPPIPGAMPEAAPPGKRASRLGLYLPLALVLAGVLGWSAWWWVARDQVERRADATFAAMRSAGWAVETAARRVDGWPFRLRVRYAGLRFVAPSGWGLAAPEAEAQAAAYALDHWVVAVPGDLTLLRPSGGPVAVGGGPVRASFAGLDASPWRVVLEGSGVHFTPAAGSEPFPLAGVRLAQLYLRPAKDGSGDGESLLRIEGLTAAPDNPLWRLLGDRPLQARAEARLTRLARFSGGGWSAAARAWTAAGGGVTVQRLETQGGAVRVRATNPATLAVGADGRLSGTVPLVVEEAPGADGSVLGAPGVTLPFDFEGGETRLGPFRLAPAPKLF